MKNERIENNENTAPNAIEDLTLNETGAENVKGGAVDMFLRLDGIKGESK